jgi:hypothetical protein
METLFNTGDHSMLLENAAAMNNPIIKEYFESLPDVGLDYHVRLDVYTEDEMVELDRHTPADFVITWIVGEDENGNRCIETHLPFCPTGLQYLKDNVEDILFKLLQQNSPSEEYLNETKYDHKGDLDNDTKRRFKRK